jgi:hypothetical protein
VRFVVLILVATLSVGLAHGQPRAVPPLQQPIAPIRPIQIPGQVQLPQPIQIQQPIQQQVPSVIPPGLFDQNLSVRGDEESPAPSQTRSPSAPLLNVAVDLSDTDVKEAYKAWTIAFITRQKETLREHRAAFAASGTMSVVVCWVAHILLAWAIVAATIEFIHALKTRQKASEVQELRVSLEGIALKTSLHGTLLLVLAMLFYYLFLKFVYPITVVPM